MSAYDETDPVLLSYDGRLVKGVRRIVNVPNPAVGAEWLLTVPGGVLWRIVGGRSSLASSAVVVSRFPGFMVTILGVRAYFNYNTSALPASSFSTQIYQQGYALPSGAQAAGQRSIPVIPYYLYAGDTFGSFTAGIDPGDAYTAIQFVVEEVYFDPSLVADLAEAQARLDYAMVRAMGGK